MPSSYRHMQATGYSTRTQDEKSEPDTDYKELVSQYHQALYEDDADKAAELLQTLTTGRTKEATPNVEEAVNKALQEAFTRQQVEQARTTTDGIIKNQLKEAVAWFENEYPDVAGNVPELRAIADNRTVTIHEGKTFISTKSHYPCRR